jgi:hypothetical protein
MMKLLYKRKAYILLILSLLHLSLRSQSLETDSFKSTDAAFRSYPAISQGIRQDFIRIPEGEFLMGSDERPDE